MTTAEATVNEPDFVEATLVPREFRDVCLRFQMPAEPSDEDLERINRRSPGWKIEVGGDDHLEVRLHGLGDSPDIDADLAVQVGNGGSIKGEAQFEHLQELTASSIPTSVDASVRPISLESDLN